MQLIKLFEVIPFAYRGSPLIYLMELSPKIVKIRLLIFFCFTEFFYVNEGREEGKYKRKERFDFNGWPTYRRILLTQTYDTSWEVLEPAKNLSSDFVKWSSAVLITTTQTKPEFIFFSPVQILRRKRCYVGHGEVQTRHETNLFFKKKKKKQDMKSLCSSQNKL